MSKSDYVYIYGVPVTPEQFEELKNPYNRVPANSSFNAEPASKPSHFYKREEGSGVQEYGIEYNVTIDLLAKINLEE